MQRLTLGMQRVAGLPHMKRARSNFDLLAISAMAGRLRTVHVFGAISRR